MKKNLLTIACAGLLALSVNAQSVNPANGVHRCSTNEYMEEMFKQNPDWKKSLDATDEMIRLAELNGTVNKTGNMVVTIPVVVHVVWQTSAQNIPDAKIQAQIAQLNLDYSASNPDTASIPGVFKPLKANTQIQFCLAKRTPQGAASTGIERIQTNVSSFSTNNAVKSTSTGGANPWPAGQYLNLWVCNLGGGLLGYAQFPGGAASTDGVVVHYGSVGSVASPASYNWVYKYGRTATHEVGHWLNLKHIWGDANCGNDQVNDTPTQQTANYSCPVFPSVTCNNGPNGDMWMNYMDYTDDLCMYMFTAGQSTRANTAITQYRSSLNISPGCTPVNTGIEDATSASEVYDVFPNPSNGIFNINFNYVDVKDPHIMIYNNVGQMVYQKSFTGFNQQLLQLDLTQLAKGFYTMQLSINNKVFNSRIAIQ